MIEDFFRDIDDRWEPSDGDRIELRLIGSSALMLQAKYDRGTKDSDVLETADMTSTIKEQLRRIAGKETEIHRRHKLYLDIVSAGVPFLPQSPRWHPLKLNERLRHLDVRVLDVVDVVVSKLKRFSASDRSDIAAMIEKGLVPHTELVARFRSAVALFEMDARAGEELPKYIRNLNQVERDELYVAESEIELPRWLRD